MSGLTCKFCLTDIKFRFMGYYTVLKAVEDTDCIAAEG